MKTCPIGLTIFAVGIAVLIHYQWYGCAAGWFAAALLEALEGGVA